ncbi:hypothetical protein OE749_17505 [Aestuariibacter sp. AA17]|uniref:HEAT repeat domain-containing protein n=1 Tax=Fluctibacter corallii TaxID=2984329 RepID=A0ABT3ACU2_9ALTE|nr:hypothetical protein [Aestuariibacter sp. AA17]MCV2886496.1 hypothetical protein [Aestuariibacter sp. AA17]
MDNSDNVKSLYQSIETNRNSYEKEVIAWFYDTDDENLRSICFEYMSYFEMLGEKTILDALASDEFGLVCLALEEVDFNSDEKIKEQLVKIANVGDEPFLVAWSLFHCVYLSFNEFQKFEPLRFKWRGSTIVRAALCFMDAAKKADYESISNLLVYLNNSDYEVRSIAVRASEYFFGSAFESLVISRLKDQEKKEELPFLKEQIQDLVAFNI